MEQTHDILKNRFFTGVTTSVESNLLYENNYYLNQTGEVETIVDFSNVRSFLSNENNQKVVKLYYSFLTASSLMNSTLIENPLSNEFIPTAEFKAIYYDDDRLADSFNNFYNTSILRGINFNYSENPDVFESSIRNQLLNGNDYKFVKQNVFNNYFFYEEGIRNESAEEKFIEIPTDGEYYFLNVFLTKRFTQTSRIAFESCNTVIFKTINSNTIFSQNPIDIIKYNEYIEFFKNPIERSIDNSPIKTPGANQENVIYEEILSGSNNQIIQCFINPNFITNENEYWSG